MPACARLATLLLPALLCVACAPAVLLPYRPDQPLTVTLPVALAGLTDARPAFAALLEAELLAAGATATELWLHGPARGHTKAAAPSGLQAAFAARAATTSVLVVGGLFGDCLGARSRSATASSARPGSVSTKATGSTTTWGCGRSDSLRCQAGPRQRRTGDGWQTPSRPSRSGRTSSGSW